MESNATVTAADWRTDMTLMDLAIDRVLPGWVPRPRFITTEGGGMACAWGADAVHGWTLWFRIGRPWNGASGSWDIDTHDGHVKISRTAALEILRRIRELARLIRMAVGSEPSSG